MDQIETRLAELQNLVTEAELSMKQLRRIKRKFPEVKIEEALNTLKEIKAKYKKELDDLNNSLVSMAEAIAAVEGLFEN